MFQLNHKEEKMKTAYSYARVSSKEQQEKKNSIPEQQRRINDYAKNNNISIIQAFTDSSSAFPGRCAPEVPPHRSS